MVATAFRIGSKIMIEFCSLFSSSSGNCTLIGDGKTRILIDAGVSAKKISIALSDREIDPATLSGIFVTHEHSDHTNGIRVLCTKHNIPVYATEGTLIGMKNIVNGKYPTDVIGNQGLGIGDMHIKPFPTPHDSLESCGYTIEFSDGRKIAVATDIGHMTDTVKENLLGCELVMLESNHDIGMLKNGAYPYYLKRRILSDVGHLCNEACAETAVELIKEGTKHLYLGHLSEENNLPQLAYQTTFSALVTAGAVMGKDFMLTVNPKANTQGTFRF